MPIINKKLSLSNLSQNEKDEFIKQLRKELKEISERIKNIGETI